MGIAILATLLMLILFMGLLAFWLERIDRRLAAVEKSLAMRTKVQRFSVDPKTIRDTHDLLDKTRQGYVQDGLKVVPNGESRHA